MTMIIEPCGGVTALTDCYVVVPRIYVQKLLHTLVRSTLAGSITSSGLAPAYSVSTHDECCILGRKSSVSARIINTPKLLLALF